MRIISRREILAELARAGLAFELASLGVPAIARAGVLPRAFAEASPYKPSADDDALLDEIQRAITLFFWEQASPETGLVKDRARADGSDTRDVASVSATGFGLTALCIADQRGYLDSAKVRDRVRTTLQFLLKSTSIQHGFFFHFLNMNTGARALKCEVSSIDTALLLCGVLAARAHFDDDEIHSLATQINDRVDWLWMLDGGKTLSHGWKPEGGFLKYRWDTYSELMMMYLLGMGANAHALPPESWDAWFRPTFEYAHLRYVGAFAPIFIHQYSHAWFDFRDKQDRYTDYFANSVIATQAHRLFCLDLASRFPQYSDDLWGISASDSVRGYVVWGGPPKMGPIDGTIVPCATAGSLPFLPEHTLQVLWAIRQRFDQRGWQRYGFVDSFNPAIGWYDQDVIAINIGISMLMAENVRTGFVWDTFMKNDEVRRGMDRAGFKPSPPSAELRLDPNARTFKQG
ncbi:MAG: glucoamylase family protein [Candidatus Acidiferrales bacterium]